MDTTASSAQDGTHAGSASGPAALRALRGPFLRFLLVGAANTLLTGVLMLVLAQWVAIEIAYTIVFMLGLAFNAIVTGPYVFRSRLTGGGVGRYASWCLGVYLVGVLVARLASHQWHVSHLATTVLVLAATVPLNFLGGARIFGGTRIFAARP